MAVAAVRETTGVAVERFAYNPARDGLLVFDGASQLALGNVTWRAFYVVRSAPTQTVMHQLELLRKDPQSGDVLLVASQVSSLQADLLRKGGIQFIDAAGNAFLKHDGVLVSVSGRRLSKDKVVAATTPKLFYESGLKLLFALMTTPWVRGHPDRVPLIGETYRVISAATGIPHSTVAWIMAELYRQKFVISPEEQMRVLVSREKIVERWTQGYIDHLRPKLLQARFTPARMDWWKEVKLSEGLWTGEVAEAKMTGVLKPGTFVIYGDPPSNDFLLRHDLRKDSEGTVEFLKPFWKIPGLNPSHPDCAHPLLVFADLLAVDDDRTREAAGKLYEDHILPFISSH